MEQAFSESAVSALLSVKSPKQAEQIVHDMLLQFKSINYNYQCDVGQYRAKHLAEEEKFAKVLLRDNAILKKGVRIQNKRFEVQNECILYLQDMLIRMQQLQELETEYQKQAEENKMLKLQNQRVIAELQKKSPGIAAHGMSMRGFHNDNNGGNGGDFHMVL